MFPSLRRALPRLLFLTTLGALFVQLSVPIGRTFGPIAAPIIFNVGVLFFAIAAGDAVLRMLQYKVDAQAAAIDAQATGNVGSGLVYLGHCILAAAVLVLFASSAHAGAPPAAALAYLPTLKAEQLAWWPDLAQPSVLGAQVGKETGPCPSRTCWNPRAQLRTSREQGIGFGQLTRWPRSSRRTRSSWPA
jgi:hypothetical protein